MAETNRTTSSKLSFDVTTTVVCGLALMEDNMGDCSEYSIELEDTWPVLEAIEELASDDVAREIAIAVLEARKQDMVEGEDPLDRAARVTDAVTAAAKAELLRILKDDIAFSVLAGRLFGAGYMVANKTPGQLAANLCR
jgi:hypothetical protein